MKRGYHLWAVAYCRRCQHCHRRYAASRIEVGQFCSLACVEAQQEAAQAQPEGAA